MVAQALAGGGVPAGKRIAGLDGLLLGPAAPGAVGIGDLAEGQLGDRGKGGRIGLVQGAQFGLARFRQADPLLQPGGGQGGQPATNQDVLGLQAGGQGLTHKHFLAHLFVGQPAQFGRRRLPAPLHPPQAGELAQILVGDDDGRAVRDNCRTGRPAIRPQGEEQCAKHQKMGQRLT